MGTLLSLSKSATSFALDVSEIALLLFGILLVVGLIGEYKSERWKKHERLFARFVIIGVAGELFADGGIFLFSKHLQTVSDLEVASLTKQAAEEHNKGLQLEKSLEHRKLNVVRYADNSSNLDALKPLAGMEFIIESVPDFEARTAASNLQAVLKEAGFKIFCTGITEDFTWEGVTIEQYKASLPYTRENMADQMESGEKALILEAFLWANGWIENGGFAKPGVLTPNMLRIRVGYKPNPLEISSKGIQAASERVFSKYAQPINKINKKTIFVLQPSAGAFPNPPKCPWSGLCK